jgi:hypothetical protein
VPTTVPFGLTIWCKTPSSGFVLMFVTVQKRDQLVVGTRTGGVVTVAAAAGETSKIRLADAIMRTIRRRRRIGIVLLRMARPPSSKLDTATPTACALPGPSLSSRDGQNLNRMI